MIIELSNIFKSYQNGKLEVPVLKDISLQIDKGEYVAIMGASGSGKSTLMNIVGCLDRPTKGEYLFEGENIFGYSDKALSDLRLNKIGFVFQSFHLLPGQNAISNVMLPLQYAGVPKKDRREIAAQVLDRVGLGDRMNFKPNQLSGGQCQRVAIARAMVNKPDILLADEPTGALDSKSGEQIMELFSKLNDEGVTVVMITHEAEIAEHAKRIIHIKDGQIIEPATEVIHNEKE
ncbi:MAG: ABC transporter ATP-binding protein [Lachnospiraceae bacterium]|nr:ABC transporter ATP-binding protein [Lachnospiraceae bacterium]